MGYIRLSENRLPEPKAYFETVLKHQPDHVDSWNNMANIHLASGDTLAAVSAFERALKTDPGFAQAHFNLGVLHAQRGLFDKAQMRLKNAIESDSTFIQAHYTLGAIYEQQDSLAAAIQSYKTFLNGWSGDEELSRRVRQKLAALTAAP